MTEPRESARGAGDGSPGGTPMGWRGIAAVTLYLVLVAALVAHGLIALWPPDRDGPAEAMAPVLERLARLETAQDAPGGGPGAGDALPVPGEADGAGAETDPPQEGPACPRGEEADRFLGQRICLSPEARLFVIVMLAGALGGLVHSLRSFYWYLGNRQLVTSWIGMYVTLPVVGAGMAVVFYVVIRGGFTPSDAGVDQTNPFGFAAMAVLVGMFTEQAAMRLKEVAETVFAKARTGKDHAGPASGATGRPAPEAVDGGARGGGSPEPERERERGGAAPGERPRAAG